MSGGEAARRAYAEYMSGGKGNASHPASQQQQQQQPPGSRLQNPYAGFGAQGQQGLQNPYAGQQYPAYNPVSTAGPFPVPPYTYPLDLSKLSTALVPAHSTNRQQYAQAQVPPAAPEPPPAVPPAPANSQQLQPYAQQGPPMPLAPRPSGYAELPRSYNQPQQTPLAERNPAWQYNQQGPPQNQGHYANAVPMAPANPAQAYEPKDWTYEATRDRNRWRYSGAWPPPDVVRVPSPPPAIVVVPRPDVTPLALCHVCSVCGQMRSAGYHRHHPIIPGHSLISTPCRRCKKRATKERERREREKAKKEEAKEQTKRKITIEIDEGEGRGRTRAREVYEVYRTPTPSPRRIVVRSSSRANIGLRTTRHVEYLPRDPSPEPSPPPVLRRRARTEIRYSSPSPPPEGVRYRFRHDEVHERRPRNSSPDAEARLAAHPTAFRTVMPGTYVDHPEQPASPPPPRGILKNPTQVYERRTRHMMEESFDSMLPEVGGNRVQFGRESREAERPREQNARRVNREGNENASDDEYTYHRRRHDRWQRAHVEEPAPPPEPPVEKFERMYIREETSPPRRQPDHSKRYEQHYRHIPADTAREMDKFYIRRSSQSPPNEGRRTQHSRVLSYQRSRTERVRSTSPPRETTAPRLRELAHKVQRTFSRSPSPPLNRKQEDWDATDSGSEDDLIEGDVYWVEFQDYDENERLATYREKRVRRPLPPGDRGPSDAPRPSEGIPEGPAITRGFAPVRDV